MTSRKINPKANVRPVPKKEPIPTTPKVLNNISEISGFLCIQTLKLLGAFSTIHKILTAKVTPIISPESTRYLAINESIPNANKDKNILGFEKSNDLRNFTNFLSLLSRMDNVTFFHTILIII